MTVVETGVDMRTSLGAVQVPSPVLTASGCPLLLGQMRRKAWLVPPIRD